MGHTTPNIDRIGKRGDSIPGLLLAGDKRRYPKLSIDKEQAGAFEELGMGHSLVHGWKGGKTEKVHEIRSAEDMGRAGKELADPAEIMTSH
jgi:hypothetical protein